MSFFYDNTNSSFTPYAGANGVNNYSVGGDKKSNIGVIKSGVAPNGTGATFNYLVCMSKNPTIASTYDYTPIFKVDQNGAVGAKGTFTSNAYPDYAEYFESFDQIQYPVGSSVVIVNPDEYELTVETLIAETGSIDNIQSLTGASDIPFIQQKSYIRLATQDDDPSDIIGVVRPKMGAGKPMIVGNESSFEWNQKYLSDEFGQPILEPYLHYVWTEDSIQRCYPYDMVPSWVKVPENAVRTYEDKYGRPYQRQKMNPYYEYDVEYSSREEREEWNLIGLLGQVPVLKTAVRHPNWRVLSKGTLADMMLIR